MELTLLCFVGEINWSYYTFLRGVGEGGGEETLNPSTCCTKTPGSASRPPVRVMWSADLQKSTLWTASQLLGFWPRWSQPWLLVPTLSLNISEFIISGEKTPYTQHFCKCRFCMLANHLCWPLFPFKCPLVKPSLSYKQICCWLGKRI